MFSSSAAAGAASRSRSSIRRRARGSPAPARLSSSSKTGAGISSCSWARRAMVRSETVAWRQPFRPQTHGSVEPGTGRWPTSPARERRPRSTVPPVAIAASTTLPTNSCTSSVAPLPAPNSSSAWASARAWLSTCTGSRVTRASSPRTGTSRQPSGPCSTTVPRSESTQPPVTTPRPSSERPAVRRARKFGRWSRIAPSTAAASPCRGSRSWAITRPRRSSSAKVSQGTPMCTPQAR